jgi:predicted DNA binding CopG/RHH family protein
VKNYYVYISAILRKKQLKKWKRKWRIQSMKFDKEEKEILEEYEKGNITTRSPSIDELKEIKSIAQNTFKKDRRITLRL